MSRQGWGVVVGLMILLIGFAWLHHLAQAPQGTDPQQILAQIRKGQQAAEARDVGALMRLVSPQFKDQNGITRPQLALQIREQLRSAQQVSVTIPLNDLQIQVAPNGREATTQSRIELRLINAQGGGEPLVFNPTLHWRKEPVRRYLIFPAEEWHVVRAEGIESEE